jgi:hypothetical protein
MDHPFTVLAGLLLCVALLRQKILSRRDIEHLDRIEQYLAARATPVVLGIVNALVVWWWMGWYVDPAPVIQDEAAYLLQAGLFARGRWTGAAPPLPEFFAQMHVLTEPVLASKYPPGLSLLLTPFLAINFPALGPMVFAAITGALIFVLARRIGNGPIALLTWLLWTSGSALLRYQASFLSQTLSLPLWLGTLYLLLEYRARRRLWALASMGGCLGMLAITRPVTAVALAVPVSVVLVRDAWRTRAWRPLALAALAGTALVAILPLQNRMTTGDWRLSPLVAYSRKYTPFDFPGFGYSATREPARLPLDLAMVRDFLTDARRRHTLPALPGTLWSRIRYATRDVFGGWRAPFLVFALLGVLTMPSLGLFALATSAGLLLAHTFHAHWPQWTAYYVEGYPAMLFASAAGLYAFAEWMIGRRVVRERLHAGRIGDPRIRAATVAMCAFVFIASAIVLPRRRAMWQAEITYQRQFKTALWLVERESPRSIIFVDYGRTHDVHSSLIWNVPDLATAKTWIAYHRGTDDLRLMRLAPDRQAYLFLADEARLTKLPPLAELERMLASSDEQRANKKP